MQDPTDDRETAITVGPDPFDQLAKGVGAGEDVVRRAPIGVLVEIAKVAILSAAP